MVPSVHSTTHYHVYVGDSRFVYSVVSLAVPMVLSQTQLTLYEVPPLRESAQTTNLCVYSFHLQGPSVPVLYLPECPLINHLVYLCLFVVVCSCVLLCGSIFITNKNNSSGHSSSLWLKMMYIQHLADTITHTRHSVNICASCECQQRKTPCSGTLCVSHTDMICVRCRIWVAHHTSLSPSASIDKCREKHQHEGKSVRCSNTFWPPLAAPLGTSPLSRSHSSGWFLATLVPTPPILSHSREVFRMWDHFNTWICSSI